MNTLLCCNMLHSMQLTKLSSFLKYAEENNQSVTAINALMAYKGKLLASYSLISCAEKLPTEERFGNPLLAPSIDEGIVENHLPVSDESFPDAFLKINHVNSGNLTSHSQDMNSNVIKQKKCNRYNSFNARIQQKNITSKLSNPIYVQTRPNDLNSCKTESLTLPKHGAKSLQKYSSQDEVVHETHGDSNDSEEQTSHVSCPLCFERFSDKGELGNHFQFNCNAVETAQFQEPKDISLFQLVYNGVKCTTCKTKVMEKGPEDHRKKLHPNKMVRHIYCSICQEQLIFTMPEIDRHCATKDHQELLKIRIDQRRQNVIQILRDNCYCLLCKAFLPFHKVAKHITAGLHAATPKRTDFWCYFCEKSVPIDSIISHCRWNTHKQNSCQSFYCLFCNQVWNFPIFIEHIIECVTENT